MSNTINEIAEAVKRMDEQLRTDLLCGDRLDEYMLFDSRHKKQRDRLKSCENSISDHVRAMVYSMLSAGRRWKNIEDKKVQIDNIFLNYDPKRLEGEPAESLENQIRAIACGNRRIKQQMKAISHNVEKLKSFEKQCGSIDGYYQKLMDKTNSSKALVKSLSQKDNKLAELGVALVAEYLRQVGYDIPKPDTHIRRVLGNRILSCSPKEIVSEFEVFDIIAEIAADMNISAAKVDFILWTYCADGYGEICTKNKPKCNKCVAKEICKM